MKTIIRPMNVNDIADVIRIRTSVKENHLSVEALAKKDITPRTIQAMIETTPCAWVAENEGTLIGFSMADHDDACLFALFVDESFHGLSIGEKLLKKAEDYLFLNHQTIWLTTANHTRAARFYRKHHWREINHDNNNEVRFEKSRC